MVEKPFIPRVFNQIHHDICMIAQIGLKALAGASEMLRHFGQILYHKRYLWPRVNLVQSAQNVTYFVGLVVCDSLFRVAVQAIFCERSKLWLKKFVCDCDEFEPILPMGGSFVRRPAVDFANHGSDGVGVVVCKFDVLALLKLSLLLDAGQGAQAFPIVYFQGMNLRRPKTSIQTFR